MKTKLRKFKLSNRLGGHNNLTLNQAKSKYNQTIKPNQIKIQPNQSIMQLPTRDVQ